MRDILNVQPGNVLIIQDILAGRAANDDLTSIYYTDSPLAEMANQSIPADMLTLNVTTGNTSQSVNITIGKDPDRRPSTSPSDTPSLVPTTTPAPTITWSPTDNPSTSPSKNPTGAPSEQPTMFPTFATNSSARGRYELTFTVQGPRDPRTMFVNKSAMCEIFVLYTADIAPQSHNQDQIYTTCPTIDGAFTTTPPAFGSVAPAIGSVAPAVASYAPAIPSIAPAIALSPQPQEQQGESTPLTPGNPAGEAEEPETPLIPPEEEVDVDVELPTVDLPIVDQPQDEDIPIPPAFMPSQQPTIIIPENNDNTRSLFLRGSSNQYNNYGYQYDFDFEYDYEDRYLQDNNTTGVPGTTPIYPIYTWRYTIVIRWTSAIWNVTDYPTLMETYINENKDLLEEELITKFNLTNSTLDIISFVLFIDITRAPTVEPTMTPSDNPTLIATLHPTRTPSDYPTISAAPSAPSDNRLPSANATPTAPPAATGTPTEKPTKEPKGAGEKAIIVVVVLVITFLAAGIMTFLILFYRKRRIQKLNAYKSTVKRRPSEGPEAIISPSGLEKVNNDNNEHHMQLSTAATISPSQISVEMSSPKSDAGVSRAASASTTSSRQPHHSKDMSNGSASLASTISDAVSSQDSQNGNNNNNNNQKQPPRSLLSDIEEDASSDGGLGDDNDDDEDDEYSNMPSPRQNSSAPFDPFAEYNDQNLERMRSNVEDNVSGLDGMMSQAMTRALIMDGPSASKATPPWHGAKTGVEIEAGALWEVTEWLKRHHNVQEDQKQDFMQELLNKMVTSVRTGVVDPEDASRTIHECAHLLGLELANQLPFETILLTGMQKTTTAADVQKTMRKFGPIEDAAVASNRGFGFVRFKTRKSIAEAIHQFRTSEVVIKNVAITLKLLSAKDDL